MHIKKQSLTILVVVVLVSSMAFASTAMANKVIRSTTFGGVFIPNAQLTNVSFGLGVAGGGGMIIALDETFRLSLDFTFAQSGATIVGPPAAAGDPVANFDGQFQTINVEASMLAVKDLGNFQPYVGIGLVIPSTTLTYTNADEEEFAYVFSPGTPFITRFGYDLSFTRRTTIGVFVRIYSAPASTQLVGPDGILGTPSTGVEGPPELIDWGGTTAGLTFNFRF